jgi:Na+-transporting NADH:ubiquinone oxidoreductase subunit D
MVMIADEVLQAYVYEISLQLSVFVGLIITNCIIMGRAEAFALHNRPGISVVDAAANGLGYTFILAIIGLVRELGGTGTIVFGERVLVAIPDYPMNLVLRGAPGAFIALGFLVALLYALGLRKEREAQG